MSHNHSHSCSHSHNPNNEKVALLGFLLTFSFMIVEVIGGWLSGSLALIADAGHMLTDAAALILAWAGFYFGRKKLDSKRSFGYYRFEVLAALFNALVLFALTFWIAYEAFLRIQSPTTVMALPMLGVAFVGLLVNCLVFYILTRGDKEHLNIKGAMLHVLGDLLGSVGAIVAAIIIYFTGWNIADPILSVFVCLLILRSTWSILKNAFNILMEGTPHEIDLNDLETHILGIPNIKGVCHIHIWAITSGKTLATMNIQLKSEKDITKTIRAVKKDLADNFGINHSTIEVGDGSCPLE